MAARLGWPFEEGDRYHLPASIAKMSAGMPARGRGPLALAARSSPPSSASMRRAGRSSILACSSLKRAYRDLLRTGAPRVRFLHLHGDARGAAGAARRPQGPFFPPELLASQYAALEPLGPTRTASSSTWRSRPRRRSRRRCAGSAARASGLSLTLRPPRDAAKRARVRTGRAAWQREIIDGKAFAAGCAPGWRRRSRRSSARHGLVPGLAVVLVGDDPASAGLRPQQGPADARGRHALRGAPAAGDDHRGRGPGAGRRGSTPIPPSTASWCSCRCRRRSTHAG